MGMRRWFETYKIRDGEAARFGKPRDYTQTDLTSTGAPLDMPHGPQCR